MQQILDNSPLCNFSGEVIHGRGIEKLVGMSTANLQILSYVKLPPNGVYITKTLYDSYTYYGITNIRIRSTIDIDSEISVETLILNFNQEIYGERLNIEFFMMLCGIRKFKDLFLF